MNRRDFLKAAFLSPIGFSLLANQSWAFSNGKDDPAGQKLIVILLRGGIDGLNVVVPYGDNRYKQIRPTIGLSRTTGLLDLDGYWGLHPSLYSLMPYFKNNTAAFVHACGSPDATRSHFDAQDYMESGVPGRKSITSGWMNRLVLQLPAKKSPLQAISLGPVLPRICSGQASFATIAKSSSGGKINRKMGRQGVAATGSVSKVFSDMYGSLDGELGRAYSEGLAARKQVSSIMQQAANDPTPIAAAEAMTKEQIIANRGALTPKSTPEFGKQLATLFTRDPSIQVAFVDFGGWDTHVREGAETGQLANLLRPLSDGLSDLIRGLGPMYNNTTIVVMSEFGRTARENGNGGTDHGHGNVMWVLGGGTPGGKVYGRWAGLADAHLNEARDLPTTTDFRSVITNVLGNQMSLSKQQILTVFPGFQGANPFVQV